VNSLSFTNVQTDNVTLNRVVYIEPSYQVYIDQVNVPISTADFNISFKVLSEESVFSVNAYGPNNETLGINTYTNLTSGVFTFQVNTTGATSFTLITVLDEMNFIIENNTAFVDDYPITDNNYSASTTIHLPSGAQLVSYDDTSLSNSTSDGNWILSGQEALVPSNSSLSSISYTGSYYFYLADSLNRVISITPSSILVQDNLLIDNIGNTELTSASFTLPSDATGISVSDSIGSIPFVNSNQTISFDLRARVYPNEKSDFLIQYSLPLSDLLKSENGVNTFSSTVLPSWLNMPAANVSLSIQLPAGSSDAVLQGGQIIPGYRLTAEANFNQITPFTNQNFVLTYTTTSPLAPYYGIIILIAIAFVIIASFSAYYIIKRRRAAKQIAASPNTDSKQKPES
jgi:hypothetical protein